MAIAVDPAIASDPAVARLVRLWRTVQALASIQALLSWDQETMMPEAGADDRAEQLAVVAGLRHQHTTADELGRAIEECRDHPEPWIRALAREARREREREVRVPARLARELAAAQSHGVSHWQRARAENRFEPFQQALERLLDLRREQAAAIGGGMPYDVLLDEFEPETSGADLQALLEPLAAELSALIAAVGDSERPAPAAAPRGPFPLDRQLELGTYVAAAIGFDFGRGRIDASVHPFCMGLTVQDVRLTWRGEADDFRPALFGILHEAGHGLYEQNLPAAWSGTPLCQAASLGVHESQSRLWENHVGRGTAFWRWLMPRFREVFPEAEPMSVEALWPTLHAVRSSLIRVDSDETTYNLHIAIRFELERALVEGSLEVAELPEAWDAAYRRYLGLEATNPKTGVLQDIHWASGLFGYFPTYTVGTLLAAQLFAAAGDAIGDLEGAIERGEFAPLAEWLHHHVHRHGASLRPRELVQAATGRALSPDAFLQYVRANCEAIYG